MLSIPHLGGTGALRAGGFVTALYASAALGLCYNETTAKTNIAFCHKKGFRVTQLSRRFSVTQGRKYILIWTYLPNPEPPKSKQAYC